MSDPSPKNLNTKKQNRFHVFVWTLFDFANTSYSIVVVTFIFAVYFKDIISLGKPVGDLYWSFGISISMIITAILSPILGAIADYSAGKKRFLLFFTLLCIISTSLLFFLSAGDILWGLILFVLANIGFEAGLVFYDAYLPELTTVKNYGRVSGYGFAMGYLGSLAILLIAYPFIKQNLIRETFPLSALFFLIFAAPLFLVLSDSRKKIDRPRSYIAIGLYRVSSTIKNLKHYKNLATFLIAFFFYIEGVNTVIFFAGNYAKSTLNFSMNELIVFFLIVQTTAIIGSLTFGIISDSIGQKKSLVISLLIWMFTIVFAYFSSDVNSSIIKSFAEFFSISSTEMIRASFYVVGLLAGSVMGATQSTSRSLMSKLTPEDKKTEFFGFYSLFGKSSAIVGPLVFGFVSYATGSQRIAILSLGIFFIIGLTILKKVEDPYVKQNARIS
ncbi:vacuole effluxer Atg22 like protein [bacterium BMS3Abin04]|nr:vacuole effluxer Atg22 like protein [bacterium BMS3Abin04]